jgi:hypothetical protein
VLPPPESSVSAFDRGGEEEGRKKRRNKKRKGFHSIFLVACGEDFRFGTVGAEVLILGSRESGAVESGRTGVMFRSLGEGLPRATSDLALSGVYSEISWCGC